jgi:peptidoglycan/xylan/chitin deacetylase (PgdA/CDA1 family)
MKIKPKRFICSLLIIAGCSSQPVKEKTPIADTLVVQVPVEKIAAPRATADAQTILSKKEVPILCYHHIKEIPATASEYIKAYTVTPAAFAEQMKALADSGYHTIVPDQLYDYLVYDAPLPAKPVMLTFDDTDEEQYRIGAVEMNKYGFKGVFFIMTVSINRPRYMTKDEIKNLSDSGHTIGAHTWDHHMVTKYTGTDWETQMVKPQKQLEAIAGKPVKYFAYPFGLWNSAVIPEIKSRGYQMAFSLATKRDTTEPLFTIRRILVPATWSTTGMLRGMRASFNK